MHRKDYESAINHLHSIHEFFDHSYQVHLSFYDHTKSDAAVLPEFDIVHTHLYITDIIYINLILIVKVSVIKSL